MCRVPLETVGYIVAITVTLAIMSPKEWHDVILDGIRKRWGLGPGGTATEDEEDDGGSP